MPKLESLLNDWPGPTMDRRLIECRSGVRNYRIDPPGSERNWLAHARELRQRIFVSTGLWPMPDKRPLRAKIFGRIEHDDYTVEKVCLESWPGFYVTGNLYRPVGAEAPCPGVLNPNGHWPEGRFGHSASGSARGRCIGFARLGCVAFSYDMIGYNDSLQVPHHLPFGDERWGQSVMGLQLWNSIRSLDFLSSLPDVDPDRIGCTGASGGGTQTFMLAAVDERVKVAAPVNMISAHFQGGCVCENAPLLRIGMTNVHIGALMAPRPMILIAATGDWTKNTPRVEYPAIRRVYRLLGAADRLECVQFQAEHNYNDASVAAVYEWFNKWLLGVDDPEAAVVRPYKVDPVSKLRVFASKAQLPRGAIRDSDRLAGLITRDAKSQLTALRPADRPSLERFQQIMGPALRHALSVDDVRPADVVARRLGAADGFDFSVRRLLIGRKGIGDRVPALLFTPNDGGSAISVVVHGDGKAALLKGGLVGTLVRGGQSVLAIDAFLTGDHHPPGARAERPKAIAFDSTFNRSDLAERVQDILTAIAFARSVKGAKTINLIGVGRGGLWCLLARAFAPDAARTVIDACGFDHDSDASWSDDMHCAGILRAGGMNTAAALAAPGALMIHNTRGRFDARHIADAYRATASARRIRVDSQEADHRSIARFVNRG